MNPYDLMFIGLSFDIVGGIALASSFIFKGLNAVFRESRGSYGYNRSLLKGALQQRGDAWAGGFLLAVGFSLQIFGYYFHGGLTTRTYGYINSGLKLAAVLILIVLFACALVWGFRKLSLRSLAWFERQIADPSAAPIKPIPGDPRHLDTIAVELGAGRLGDESDDAMAERLTKIRAENAQRGYNSRPPAGPDESA